MPNCNRQMFKTCIQLGYIIDRFYFCQNIINQISVIDRFIIFKIPLLDCSQGSQCNNQVLFVCTLVCLCTYVFFTFLEFLHLNIMSMCYVYMVYVFICFNYVLYTLFIYNERMTSPHQSNTSCGCFSLISQQSNASEDLSKWVSSILDLLHYRYARFMFWCDIYCISCIFSHFRLFSIV